MLRHFRDSERSFVTPLPNLLEKRTKRCGKKPSASSYKRLKQSMFCIGRPKPVCPLGIVLSTCPSNLPLKRTRSWCAQEEPLRSFQRYLSHSKIRPRRPCLSWCGYFPGIVVQLPRPTWSFGRITSVVHCLAYGCIQRYDAKACRFTLSCSYLCLRDYVLWVTRLLARFSEDRFWLKVGGTP